MGRESRTKQMHTMTTTTTGKPITYQMVIQATWAVINRGFWGRMKWLLLGR